MDAPKCKNCDKRHYGMCDTFSQRNRLREPDVVLPFGVGDIGDFTGATVDVDTASNEDATNIVEPLDTATNNVIVATNTATNSKVSDRTLNRRSRAAYNEYQREYMRRRRGGD